MTLLPLLIAQASDQSFETLELALPESTTGILLSLLGPDRRLRPDGLGVSARQPVSKACLANRIADAANRSAAGNRCSPVESQPQNSANTDSEIPRRDTCGYVAFHELPRSRR